MRITVVVRSIAWEAPAADPAGHACEPRIVRRAGGEIVLAHRLGTRRESADGRPHLLRSADGGRTWEDLGQPLDDLATPGWDLRGAALAELPSGELLTVVVGLDKSIDRPTYNPATEGLIPVANTVARSADGGRTWARLPDLSGGPVPQTASQGLLVLPGGEVLCTFETFKAYDEAGPWRYLGGLLRSGDGGRTWGECVISAASDPDGDPHDTMWWDPRIARLASGELVKFVYAFRHRDGTEGPVHALWSADEGRTWTPPTSTGLAGQASYPIPLADGRLVVLSQRRGPEQSVVANISDDGGRSFDATAETVVYEHAGASAPGARGELSAFDYLMSMDHFTFGHPCGVATGPDEVLAIWYAGGPIRTAIHSARLRLD
jgi:BNR repeat-like domain